MRSVQNFKLMFSLICRPKLTQLSLKKLDWKIKSHNKHLALNEFTFKASLEKPQVGKIYYSTLFSYIINFLF